MSHYVNDEADSLQSSHAGRQRAKTLLDQIVNLGDELLADGSLLVNDLDSAIAMDNVLFRLENFIWEFRLESESYIATNELDKHWQELCTSLTELQAVLSDVQMPQKSSTWICEEPWTSKWHKRLSDELLTRSRDIEKQREIIQDLEATLQSERSQVVLQSSDKARPLPTDLLLSAGNATNVSKGSVEASSEPLQGSNSTTPPRAASSGQANSGQPLQDFQAWIWRERVTGSQDDCTAGLEDFIPAGEVAAYLCQPGKLTGILTALFGDNRGHIDPRQLLNRYSVVFAILVSIDHGQYIGNFTPHDALCDARLPFTKRPRRFPLDQGSSNLFYERFATAQVRFCAPKFTEGHCEFEAEERLPFLEKLFIDDGGSAKVYRVKLHAEHDLIHRPQSPPESGKRHRIYALKAYSGEDGKRWHSIETATFERLKRTGLDTAHIIGYHCSFEHRDVRYALLEYADKHTLEDFIMHKDSVPPSLDQEILDFWENVLLVIVGIGEIHDLDADSEDTPEPGKFTGIHQDIKPKNILVKSKENSSSIYDSSFGLGDLGTSSVDRTRSRQAPRDKSDAKTYSSPECFQRDSVDGNRDIKITTKADIWSFGCVLSELCIWVIFGSNGPHGLKSYRQRRENHNIGVARGADCFHLNGQASQVVLDEHKKAAAQGKCDRLTKAILMLIPEMLRLEPQRRPDAQQLRTRFAAIIDKAKGARNPNITQSIFGTPTHSEFASTTPSWGTSTTPYWTSNTTPYSITSSSSAPARVRRTTQSNSFGSVDYYRPIVEGALQTETARQYTVESDKHGNAIDTVSSASAALMEQLGEDRIEDTDSYLNPVASKPQAMLSGTGRDQVGQVVREGVLEESSAARASPSRLDFKLALQWRQEKRSGRSLTKLPDERLLTQLTGRHHVFVVDDCKSMGELRAASRAKNESEITDYVDVLSYMVKRHDADGVDLLYLNSMEAIKHCRDTTRMVTSVRSAPFAGLSNPEPIVNSLIRSYLDKVMEYKAKLRAFEVRGRRSLFGGMPKLPTPLSVYILTDGVWELPDTTGGGYLQDTISDLIEGLRSAGCARDQVGIQFIRFGSHEHGVQRLESLERLGKNHDIGMDIVDTEPVEDNNVFKMLLGAISPRFDAD